MTKNVGGTEKSIRLGLGLILVLAALLVDFPSWGTATLSVVGVIALITGTAGYCPAWSLFGFNTCSWRPKA